MRAKRLPIMRQTAGRGAAAGMLSAGMMGARTRAGPGRLHAGSPSALLLPENKGPGPVFGGQRVGGRGGPYWLRLSDKQSKQTKGAARGCARWGSSAARLEYHVWI